MGSQVGLTGVVVTRIETSHSFAAVICLLTMFGVRLLVLFAFAGVTSGCDTTGLLACTSTYTTAAQARANDNRALCEATTAYSSCIQSKGQGCANQAALANAATTAAQAIPGGCNTSGCPETSVFRVILPLVLWCFAQNWLA